MLTQKRESGRLYSYPDIRIYIGVVTWSAYKLKRRGGVATVVCEKIPIAKKIV